MDKIYAPIKERILQYLDLKKITKEDFYKISSIASSNFKGKGAASELGGDKIAKILTMYPDLNSEWLITGKGDITKSKLPVTTDKPEAAVLIPLYDTIATAGSLSTAEMAPVTEPVEMINAGDWFRDATAAMRVHGDSMYPAYPSGSIVAIKEVMNKRLVMYGEDYVIETSEYRVIKRLQRSEDKNCWLAYSVNNELWQSGPLAGKPVYEPFDIHKEDVTRLFIVLGSVKRNHSSRIIYNTAHK